MTGAVANDGGGAASAEQKASESVRFEQKSLTKDYWDKVEKNLKVQSESQQ